MGPHAESRKARSAEDARFEAFLRSKKLKLTGERLTILASIFGRESHFDAESGFARRAET
jgi:Fe2+ or Zn2+ uptake regulation protein